MHDEIADLVAKLAERLLGRGESLALAESCTGGWVAKVCTDRAGSSAWLERGFVTYSNAAKTEMLDVDPATLALHGAVSEAVVHEMAAGALHRSHADWSVAISGVAGPDGGTPDKPVGTVWFAWAGPGVATARRETLPGDRAAVREASVGIALAGLLQAMADVD